MNWSKWIIFNDESLSNISEKSGVYKIKCHKKIYRLKCKDKKGILMIGQSKNLKRRIKEFWKSVLSERQSKSESHSEGNRFYQLFLEDDFPKEKLKFAFRVSKNAKDLEKKLLEEYQKKHGELPPLNNSGGL